MENTIQSLFKDKENLVYYIDGNTQYSKKEFFEIIKNNKIEKKLDHGIYFCDEKSTTQYLINFFSCIINQIPFVALNPDSPESEKNLQKEEVLKDPKKDFDLVIFTSGSTGRPKGVTLKISDLLIAARSSVEHYSFKEGEGYGLTLPLFHIGGLMIPLRMLLSHGKFLICDPKNIKSFFSEDIQYLSLVSTQLLKICDSEDQDLIHLKGIILGGARTPKEILKKAIQKNLLLSNSYGQSETCAQVMATKFTNDLEILESVGSILPYRKIDFNENAIVIHPPGISKRYIGEKKERQNISPSDSFEKRDEHFFVTGRIDNIFHSGGENINPEEIEKEILAYPGVEDVIVAATDHISLDKVAVAHVQSQIVIDPLHLNEFLEERLTKFKIPKCFYISTKQDYLVKGIKKNRKIAQEISLPESTFRQVCYGNPENPMIVFLHGFMGKKEDFCAVIELLWHNYFCVSIDLYGHGQSHKNHASNWDELILKLSQHLNSYKRNFSLYGYSQGGRVAIALKKHLPLCQKILIESANAGIEDHEKSERLKFEKSFFQNINSIEDFKLFLKKWYSMPLFGNILHHECAHKLFEKDYNLLKDWEKTLEYMSLAAQRNYWPEISTIANDLYFAAGDQDLKYMELGKRFESFGAKFTVFKDHAHNIHFESPLRMALWIKLINP